MKTEYDKQANKFLKDTGTTFKVKYYDHDYYFANDREARDIYKVTLKNNNGSYTFKFGQSIANQGIEPTAYDVLACLTKYDPGDFDMFCDEFGYDRGDKSARRTYIAVVREHDNLCRLYSDSELDAMSEIS